MRDSRRRRSRLPGKAVVLAQSGDGRTLARATLDLPAGASPATPRIVLPPELRNRLSRLVLEGPPTAGSVVLLDERWRRRPVGLLAGDLATADTPFAGPLYYLHRALAPYTEVREADLATLLQRELSVLILADRPLPAGAERDALTQMGGARRTADPLRRSAHRGTAARRNRPAAAGEAARRRPPAWWGVCPGAEPAGLAQFPPTSPFAGLAVPDEVKVNRQVLAEPSADLAAHTWATLADGTPLVTEATEGAGRIVLFHVTANADWSNLPLSGLFVDMLRRLVALSVGVAPISDNSDPGAGGDAGRVSDCCPRRRRQRPACQPTRSHALQLRRAIRQGCTGRRTDGARSISARTFRCPSSRHR